MEPAGILDVEVLQPEFSMEKSDGKAICNFPSVAAEVGVAHISPESGLLAASLSNLICAEVRFEAWIGAGSKKNKAPRMSIYIGRSLLDKNTRIY